VVPFAVVFIRIATAAFLFISASMIIGGAYWGSGDTKPPMYIAIATTWLINVPAVFIAIYALEWSVYSIYWLMLVTEALNFAAFWWLFRRGSWKRVRV
jgi:Na+-driven multidrug efflux pump